MKRIIILLLTIASFNSYGQETATEGNNSNFKRVQIGVNVSPDICYRILINPDKSKSGSYIKNFRDSTEIMKVGYTAGLNVCFNLKSFVSIEAGIQYSNRGYQTKVQEPVWVTSDGNIDPSPNSGLPKKIKYIYNYHFVDLPVKVNFTFGKKKVRLFTSAGLTTNILIMGTQKDIYEFSGKTEIKTEKGNIGNNRFDISPTISVGIDYKINERMNLRVEPTFRCGIINLIVPVANSFPREDLYNAGLNISFYFGT